MKNWIAIDRVIYEVPSLIKKAMTASYWFGWLFLVSSTFAIDHFDLFGLRQGLKMGNVLKFYNDGEFVTNYHYKYVRHPIMTGFFFMFWSIQSLTIGIV